MGWLYCEQNLQKALRKQLTSYANTDLKGMPPL
jgi:hypothetical protein